MDAALFRSLDGTGNNLAHPEWGSTNEQLLRIAPAEYADGISAPAGADRPSARLISNALAAHSDADTHDNRDLSAYIYVWGQFLDHDLDLTSGGTPAELLNIPVPAGDASFDPTGSGGQVIPLVRSIFDSATGLSSSNPRQQLNQITAWIDGSMIYGSDTVRAAALRTFSGGMLKVSTTSQGDLPPLNSVGLPNANDSHRAPSGQLFLAGDVRANENIELTSMHTLFLREHNRLAGQIAQADPGLSDQEIYQRARASVIAELQVITYKQWLPALIGSGVLQPYRGYNPNVNPGIANEFSTAAFRLHSTINDDVEFFDNTGHPKTFDYVDDYGATTSVDGGVALADAFFNPTMFAQTGPDGILKYAASTHAEALDSQLVDSLRNFLFGQPGQGGLDLAALNIQRGRDHGLADYNAVRVAYGLPAVTRFSQITSDTQLQQSLQQLYGSVDNIDLWVGAAAEDHVRGSSTGPLIQRILADQFQRLRDGDRFWYQRIFSGQELATLERTTLADVIERNSDVQGLQTNVFFFRAQAGGQVFVDTNGNGRRDRGESPLGNVNLELLNDEGAVIASTRTDRDGRYRFAEFPETGDYQIRMAAMTTPSLPNNSVQSFVISTGDALVRGLDFAVHAPRRSPTPHSGGWLGGRLDGHAFVSAAMPAALVDDNYEQNDTLATASNLGTIAGPVTIGQLVQADSNDWYRFTITTAGGANDSISINFQHSQGDLDFGLYNARGQRLRSSTGVSNTERISLSALPAGAYYARVYGYRGVTNPDYSLSISLAHVSAPPPPPPATTGGFDIQFAFSGLTTSQQAIFEQAAAKWESIIRGDLPNATFNGQVVDDLLISAAATPIDGRGNILGQAGPDRFRSGSQLPYHGTMQFDSADLAAMQANGTLLGVIEHEMGHVLGIGTLWSSKGLLVGAGTSNPRFIGAQATAQYDAIFGQNAAGVPVEAGGGSGTRDAHWSESLLGNELMTGYVGPSTSMPISRITVASLADLGYSVEFAAADPYAPPWTSSVLLAAA